MCKDCNTASYNCHCIVCTARLILSLPLSIRKHSIEMQDRFDIDELKAEVTKQHGGKK